MNCEYSSIHCVRRGFKPTEMDSVQLNAKEKSQTHWQCVCVRERSGEVLCVDWLVFALKSRWLPKCLENIVFSRRSSVWLSCMWKNHQSLYNSTHFTLFCCSFSLTSGLRVYITISLDSIHDVCMCADVCECVLLRCIHCLSFMCGRSCLRYSNFVLFLSLARKRVCLCVWVCVFFTLIVECLSFVHSYQAYGKQARTWHMFSFFDEQEGQLRIVIRTVQTYKSVCARATSRKI